MSRTTRTMNGRAVSRLTAALSLAALLLAGASPLPANAQETPTFIYGIAEDGTLKWYKHNGFMLGEGLDDSHFPPWWEGPNDVGFAWQHLKQVFSGGNGIIYAVAPDGTLKWYDHSAFVAGTGLAAGLDDEFVPSSGWVGPKDVGVGWNFKHVFSGGNRIIYAVSDDGTLRWYKHNGFATGDGLDVLGAWEGPREVGFAFQDFKEVFSGGNGILYAIAQDGTLKWFRHNAFATGGGLVAGQDDEFVPATTEWEGPKNVGTGWQGFKQVFSAGSGIIYAIAQDGTLKWYRHVGYVDGTTEWEGPKDVGTGWQSFRTVFASPLPKLTWNTPIVPETSAGGASDPLVAGKTLGDIINSVSQGSPLGLCSQCHHATSANNANPSIAAKYAPYVPPQPTPGLIRPDTFVNTQQQSWRSDVAMNFIRNHDSGGIKKGATGLRKALGRWLSDGALER